MNDDTSAPGNDGGAARKRPPPTIELTAQAVSDTAREAEAEFHAQEQAAQQAQTQEQAEQEQTEQAQDAVRGRMVGADVERQQLLLGARLQPRERDRLLLAAVVRDAAHSNHLGTLSSL